MKHRKEIRNVIIAAAICLCLNFACSMIGEQSYTCDVDKVKRIQIVKLDEYHKEFLGFDYTVLCEVEDKEVFLEKLLNIDQEPLPWWGSPHVLTEGQVVIRIEYLDGYYDLVACYVQSKYREEENQAGCICFDGDQFRGLLSEYVEESVLPP